MAKFWRPGVKAPNTACGALVVTRKRVLVRRLLYRLLTSRCVWAMLGWPSQESEE